MNFRNDKTFVLAVCCNGSQHSHCPEAHTSHPTRKDKRFAARYRFRVFPNITDLTPNIFLWWEMNKMAAKLILQFQYL